MTHWRTLIEKDHLGAWDLQGKEWNLTIARVETRKVYNQKAKGERGRLVITFAKAGGAESKPWICNSTNAETIEGLYGGDFEQWAGKVITLYPTTTSVGKKQNIPCVRVRNKVPQGKPAATAPSAPVDPGMRASQDAAFDREPGEEG